MPDAFASLSPGLDSPGRDFFAIAPNDGADIPIRPRAVYVGTAGDLSVIGDGGAAVTLRALAVGWHPIRPLRIRATGTTAADIVGVV